MRIFDHLCKIVKKKICPGMDGEERMSVVTDILWQGLNDKGLDWVGFYVLADNEEEMVLVCREPKPACSPIGLHGVCGKALKDRTPQVVDDVHALGGDHIVCDPENLSEIVMPLIKEDGSCEAVLDLDSRQLSSFDGSDVLGLEKVLKAAGLTV